MKTFNIIKKNRKYFAAKLNSKYSCKILIDENSEALDLGIQNLEVDDISVRSKYGTDLIFKLKGSVDEQKNAGICTLKTAQYNEIIIKKCRELGGKWDSANECWIFSGMVSSEVEELDYQINSEKIIVEVTANKTLYAEKSPVYFLGYVVARAFGRDSGAKLGDNIALISGDVTSGGSMKNWATRVVEGSIFKLEIPSEFYNANKHMIPENVTVKVL